MEEIKISFVFNIEGVFFSFGEMKTIMKSPVSLSAHRKPKVSFSIKNRMRLGCEPVMIA